MPPVLPTRPAFRAQAIYRPAPYTKPRRFPTPSLASTTSPSSLVGTTKRKATTDVPKGRARREGRSQSGSDFKPSEQSKSGSSASEESESVEASEESDYASKRSKSLSQFKRDRRVEIAMWVYNQELPYSIVEDPVFVSLVKAGRPYFYLPSARTVYKDVKSLFDFGSEDFDTFSGGEGSDVSVPL